MCRSRIIVCSSRNGQRMNVSWSHSALASITRPANDILQRRAQSSTFSCSGEAEIVPRWLQHNISACNATASAHWKCLLRRVNGRRLGIKEGRHMLFSIHTRWGSNHYLSATAPRRLNYVVKFFYPQLYYLFALYMILKTSGSSSHLAKSGSASTPS